MDVIKFYKTVSFSDVYLGLLVLSQADVSVVTPGVWACTSGWGFAQCLIPWVIPWNTAAHFSLHTFPVIPWNTAAHFSLLSGAPHKHKDIQLLEKVQCWAGWYVTNNYMDTSTDDQEWTSLNNEDDRLAWGCSEKSTMALETQTQQASSATLTLGPEEHTDCTRNGHNTMSSFIPPPVQSLNGTSSLHLFLQPLPSSPPRVDQTAVFTTCSQSSPLNEFQDHVHSFNIRLALLCFLLLLLLSIYLLRPDKDFLLKALVFLCSLCFIV